MLNNNLIAALAVAGTLACKDPGTEDLDFCPIGDKEINFCPIADKTLLLEINAAVETFRSHALGIIKAKGLCQYEEIQIDAYGENPVKDLSWEQKIHCEDESYLYYGFIQRDKITQDPNRGPERYISYRSAFGALNSSNISESAQGSIEVDSENFGAGPVLKGFSIHGETGYITCSPSSPKGHFYCLGNPTDDTQGMPIAWVKSETLGQILAPALEPLKQMDEALMGISFDNTFNNDVWLKRAE